MVSINGLLKLLPNIEHAELSDTDIEGKEFTYKHKESRYNYDKKEYAEVECEHKQSHYAKVGIREILYKGDIYKVLVCSIYTIGKGLRKLTVYIMGGKYITFNYERNCWSRAKITHLMYFGWQTSLRQIYCEEKSKEETRAISALLGEKKGDNLIDLICRYQDKNAERELKAKHAKIKSNIDADLEGIPALPSDLKEFVNEEVLSTPCNRVIVYERRKGQVTGKCTYCGETVVLSKVQHGHVTTCPSCKSKVTPYSKGKAKSSESNTIRFQLLQKYNGKFVVRGLIAKRIFSEKFMKMKDIIWESNIITIDINSLKNGEVKSRSYIWDNFMQTGEKRWCSEDKWGCSHRCSIVYRKGLEKVLQDTPLRYVPIAAFAKHAKEFRLYDFISAAVINPKLELLIKCKLWHTARDIVSEAWSKGANDAFCEKLLKHRQSLQVLQYMNIGTKETEYYFKLLDEKKQVDIKRYKYLCEEKLFNIHNIERLLKHVSFNKMAGYAKQQKLQLKDWLDYIGECAKLEYNLGDTQIITPKKFYEAHRRTSRIVTELQEKGNYEKYQNAVKKFAELEYENTKFSIILPASGADIVYEGKVLNHCVGGYVSRITQGYTLIFFVRKVKEKDKPYYTLELSPKTLEVQQCRGYRNDERLGGRAEPEVLKFVEEWKSRVLEKKKKKEKRREKVAG